MPAAAQALVHVRVVDDLAGEEDVALREPAPGLIGVVDGTVDAVAEAELAGQVQGEPAGDMAIVRCPHGIDEAAVIGSRELSSNGLLHVEALAEDQRFGGGHVT